MTLLASWSNAGYSPLAMAQQCALCAMVYADDLAGIRALVEPEGELVRYHDSDRSFKPTLVIVKSGPTSYFVNMEGTVSVPQALGQGGPQNLRYPFAYRGIGLETYVGLYWRNAYEVLAAEVAQHIPLTLPGLTIHVSGHSYGGAVAAVAGYSLAKQGFDRVKVMTFGAPRFFAGVEPEPAPLAYHRVYSATDPIPMYPSARLGLNLASLFTPNTWSFTDAGWLDIGLPVPLAVDGTVGGEPSTTLTPAPDVVSGGGGGEHGLGNYLGRLRQMCERDL